LRGHEATIGKRLERVPAAFQPLLRVPHGIFDKVPTAVQSGNLPVQGSVYEMKALCGTQVTARHRAVNRRSIMNGD
jgi:hypothetical protein